MNRTYKVIYNRTRHLYQVVSELAKSRGKSDSLVTAATAAHGQQTNICAGPL